MDSFGLSDRLVEALLQQALGEDDAPCQLTFIFGRCCRSRQGLRCISKALRNNKTISALTIRFLSIEKGLGSGTDREDIDGFCHFLAHNPSLTVVNVLPSLTHPTAVAPTNKTWNALLCWILEAVSRNDKVEKIRVEGWICKHVDEIVSTSLKELEVLDWKEDQLPESWPSLPIKTLKLSPYYSVDRNCAKALSPILDTFFVPANVGVCSITHLALGGWTWSLPSFLRSNVTRVETLHLLGIDFSHDEETGCSKMDGLLFGLCGSSTTTSVCFGFCTFDLRACEKLKEEIQLNRISVKYLQLKECMGSYYGIDVLFWSCTNLSGLGLDGDEENVPEETLTCVKAGLDRGTLSSVMIPRSVTLTSIGASLTNACTTGSLTHLDLPFGIANTADVDFLINLLENEQCQLTHFALNCGNNFSPGIVSALGKQRALDSLCLCDSGAFGGNKAEAIFEALDLGLSQIGSLTSLSLTIVRFLSPSMEKKLITAIAGNWSLERVSVHLCDSLSQPLLSVGGDKTTKKLLSRNKAKKTINAIVAASPNLSEEQKKQTVDCMKVFADLPDEGVPLNFWVLREQFIDTFF